MINLLVIVGPTAVGKSEIAIKLALKYGGEIVSADSIQIYKAFDIGSAKPSKEELQAVPHHLIGEIDPKTKFTVADYQELALERIKDINSRGKIPVLCGGTGLYVNSILYRMNFADTYENLDYRESLYRLSAEELHAKLSELNPKMATRIHVNNKKRVVRALEVIQAGGKIDDFRNSYVQNENINPLIIGLNRDRKILYNRINDRVDKLMDNGLLDEVKQLVESGLNSDDTSMQGIGYKEIYGYLSGQYDLEHAVYLIKRNSRRYAKRQITWFKRYENINWINMSEDQWEKKLYHIIKVINPTI